MLSNIIEEIIIFFEKIGELRDGFLVLTAVTYFLGYIVWSIISWKLNLGLLSVIDSQYLVAGIPILISLLAIFLTIRYTKYLLLCKWPNYLEKKSITDLIIIFAILLVICFMTVLFSISIIEKYNNEIVTIIAILIPFLCFTLLFSGLYQPFDKLFSDKLTNTNFVIEAYVFLNYMFAILKKFAGNYSSRITMILVFLFLLFIKEYSYNFYLKIPQSLGGAQPRLAIIDIVVSDFSKDTLDKLGLDQISRKVGRSKPFNIYYSGQKTIIGSPQNSSTIVVEINKGSVKAIEWL